MNTDYTPDAQQALAGAEDVARRFGHSYIGTEHILCAILAIPTCEACRRFNLLDIDPDELRLQIEQMIGRGENLMVRGDIPLTARTKKILQLAKLEASHQHTSAVGTEHLVLAMLREGESVGAQLLFNKGLDAEKFLAIGADPSAAVPPETAAENGEESADDAENDAALRMLGEKNAPQNKKAGKTPALNTFGRDLTALALSLIHI